MDAFTYYMSANMSLSQNRELAEPQIRKMEQWFLENDIDSFSYDKILSQVHTMMCDLVELHKRKFPLQGWDINDKDSVSWFLVMLSRAVERTTNAKYTNNNIFVDVFNIHFNS